MYIFILRDNERNEKCISFKNTSMGYIFSENTFLVSKNKISQILGIVFLKMQFFYPVIHY